VSAAQARSRQRERLATDRCAEVEERLKQSELTASLELDAHRQVVMAMARSIRSSCYAPSARIALEQVERLAKFHLCQALILPSGGDARGWAAVAHDASPRNKGPLVFVDPINAAVYPKPWASSEGRARPLAGGNLVLIDPIALDLDTQQSLASWLSIVSAESKQDSGCILVVRSPLANLVGSLRMHDSLARRFLGAETEIPTLADRGEDIRAMVLEKAARLGMSLYGAPRAVDTAVLAELLDYDWPGNELELDSVVLQLVQRAASPLITLADLEQINFSKARVTESGTPLPPVATRRPPHRVVSQRPR